MGKDVFKLLETTYAEGAKAWNSFYVQRDIMRRRDEIEARKYYEGFKYGRDKAMFEEELRDLMEKYYTELGQIEDKLEDATERHIRHAQVFIDVQKQKAEINEKLDTLLAKLGKGDTDE